MSNPLVHAERSAKRWGGKAEDYLAIHQWFDATKAHLPDNRHRMILHNGFGIMLAEQVFGLAITNSDSKRVFVREIGQQHILEDLGWVPSLAECLQELPLRLWMAGARRIGCAGRSSDGAAHPANGTHCECNSHDVAHTSGDMAEHQPL
jgi:hypothetical protein